MRQRLAHLILGLWFAVGAAAFAQTATNLPGVKPLSAPGIHNLFALDRRLYSGSSPEGDEAFAALKKLGVKTIISVDGAKPEVERAAKFGLRYIHLPFGYDGIARTNVVRLLKAAQTVAGVIYVHCHHGLHRGPAAAAVICEGTLGWSTTQAVAWLHAAGTAPDYKGLYKSVGEFQPPTAAELRQVPLDFAARATTSALVDTMVEIDERWSRLQAVRQANFAKAPAAPDLDAAHEALLLQESFRELIRSAAVKGRNADFMDRLHHAESASGRLHALLKENPVAWDAARRKTANDLFDAVKSDCTACHRTYRN